MPFAFAYYYDPRLHSKHLCWCLGMSRKIFQTSQRVVLGFKKRYFLRYVWDLKFNLLLPYVWNVKKRRKIAFWSVRWDWSAVRSPRLLLHVPMILEYTPNTLVDVLEATEKIFGALEVSHFSWKTLLLKQNLSFYTRFYLKFVFETIKSAVKSRFEVQNWIEASYNHPACFYALLWSWATYQTHWLMCSKPQKSF